MQISFIEIETNRCLYKCCAGHSLFIFFSLGHGIYLSQRKLVKPEVVALGLRCDINFKSLLWLWNKSALTHHIFSGAHCIYCVVNGDFLTFQFYRFEIQSNCPRCLCLSMKLLAYPTDETFGLDSVHYLFHMLHAIYMHHIYIYAVTIQFLVLWCT